VTGGQPYFNRNGQASGTRTKRSRMNRVRVLGGYIAGASGPKQSRIYTRKNIAATIDICCFTNRQGLVKEQEY